MLFLQALPAFQPFHFGEFTFIHYFFFSHSLEDWTKNQVLVASTEQQEDSFEADQRREEASLQSSKEKREAVEEVGNKTGMSSTEEGEYEDELQLKTQRRREDETSTTALPSVVRRSKGSLSAAEELEAVQSMPGEKDVNKEVGQLVQVDNYFSFNPVMAEVGEGQLKHEVEKVATILIQGAFL